MAFSLEEQHNDVERAVFSGYSLEFHENTKKNALEETGHTASTAPRQQEQTQGALKYDWI